MFLPDDYGEHIEGEEFPAFREPIGVNTDKVFLGVNVGKWLNGRELIGAEVEAENSDIVSIDSVSYDGEIIAFRVSTTEQGNHKLMITAKALNAEITRTRLIQAKPL